MENFVVLERSTNKKVEALKLNSFNAIQNAMTLLEQEGKASDEQFYHLTKLFTASSKEELGLNHAQSEIKSIDIIWKRTCQEFLKNMKVFSLCATLESKFKITITPLDPDAIQTIQCKQAVYDSVDPKLLKKEDSIIKGVDVSNVIKIENQILSQQFQEAASVLDESKVKIKGIFCSISKESVYSFASYGLDPNNSKSKSNIFQQPWFLRNDTSSSSSTSKYTTQQQQQYEQTAKTPSAKELASKNAVDSRYLRFSKHIINSSLFTNNGNSNNGHSSSKTNNTDMNNNSDNNPLLHEAIIEAGGGICLVLCRVLLYRVCTVPGVIDEKDMIKAQQKGYDAIYSQALEEYALLNSAYILPEFIMHTAIHQHTLSEQLKLCRTKLNNHMSGLIDGFLPLELKSFLHTQECNEKDDKEGNNGKQLLMLPKMDASNGSSIGYYGHNHFINNTLNRYARFQQSFESNTKNQMSNNNDNNDLLNEGSNIDDYGYTTNNNNNNGNNNKSSTIVTKKKRKSVSGIKRNGINGTSASVPTIAVADTTLSLNNTNKVDELVRLELEWRRQQRVELMQCIEQVTRDFTVNRSAIIKDIFSNSNS